MFVSFLFLTANNKQWKTISMYIHFSLLFYIFRANVGFMHTVLECKLEGCRKVRIMNIDVEERIYHALFANVYLVESTYNWFLKITYVFTLYVNIHKILQYLVYRRKQGWKLENNPISRHDKPNYLIRTQNIE